ncbi:MAG: hypothetical protein AAFR65_16585 [Pseudomonadota bacterium]
MILTPDPDGHYPDALTLLREWNQWAWPVMVQLRDLQEFVRLCEEKA